MKLDVTSPAYGTAGDRHQDLLRIAAYIGSPKSRNYKTKLNLMRPKHADDGSLEAVGERNTICPAYRRLPC